MAEVRLEPHAFCSVLCSLVQSTLQARGLSGCWARSEPFITWPTCTRMAEWAGTLRHNFSPHAFHFLLLHWYLWVTPSPVSTHLEIWDGSRGQRRPELEAGRLHLRVICN